MFDIDRSEFQIRKGLFIENSAITRRWEISSFLIPILKVLLVTSPYIFREGRRGRVRFGI